MNKQTSTEPLMAKPSSRKLVAVLACRMNSTRLYAKPLHYLDIDNKVTILEHLIRGLQSVASIDEVVLAISDGAENISFELFAKEHGVRFIRGDEDDVLGRMILAGEMAEATDIFRVTSESPFPQFDKINSQWQRHITEGNDATFFDLTIDGCGFEIITAESFKLAHSHAETTEQLQAATLYFRENPSQFKIDFVIADDVFRRQDLRLTIDYPEDLILCRACYQQFAHLAPHIPVKEIITYLDQNPDLKKLTAPYVEAGYATMYIGSSAKGGGG